MAVAATIKYFGRFPTVIVMQSSSAFDGSAQTGIPVIQPGTYVFPVQAAGGLYNFHEEAIEVKQIAYDGGGTLTVTRVLLDASGATIMSTALATVTGATPVDFTNLFLSPREVLKFSSSGGTNPKVCVTGSLAQFIADGGG